MEQVSEDGFVILWVVGAFFVVGFILFLALAWAFLRSAIRAGVSDALLADSRRRAGAAAPTARAEPVPAWAPEPAVSSPVSVPPPPPPRSYAHEAERTRVVPVVRPEDITAPTEVRRRGR